MNRSSYLSVSIAALLLGLMVGCGPKKPETKAATANSAICTSFYPVTYFAQRIASGSGVGPVTCLCPEDEDAIFWQPSREAMLAFQDARLVIVNGAEFEKWFLIASLPNSQTIVSARQLPGERIAFTNTTTHSHGPSGEHTHKGIDGHTWVDPINAIAQAREICRGMGEAFPADKPLFEKNLAALDDDLKQLDHGFAELAPLLTGKTLLCSHPAYNYIARRYDWTIKNFDLDPGAPLADAQRADIANVAKQTGARIMLWESAPIAKAEEQLTTLGIRSIEFSPAELLSAANATKGVDYLTVMNGNLNALREALETGQ